LKSLHDQANPPANARPELIACLQSLVEPWLALHSLANLDRKTLAGLWQTCLQLDAKLMPSRRSTLPNYGMWSLVCIFVLSLVAGSLLFFRTVPSSATDLLASGIQSHSVMIIGLSVALPILGMIVFFLRRPGS